MFAPTLLSAEAHASNSTNRLRSVPGRWVIAGGRSPLSFYFASCTYPVPPPNPAVDSNSLPLKEGHPPLSLVAMKTEWAPVERRRALKRNPPKTKDKETGGERGEGGGRCCRQIPSGFSVCTVDPLCTLGQPRLCPATPPHPPALLFPLRPPVGRSAAGLASCRRTAFVLPRTAVSALHNILFGLIS